MSDDVLILRQVTREYSGRLVLRDLNLSVPRGSVYGLLGCNGAGKTTLIKCALGLIRPQSGQVRVLGEDPRDFSAAVKERIGFVPQSGRAYPWLTVRQLVDYTGSFYPHWNSGLVARLISEWSLHDTERVGALSEGQAQKLAIILALGHEPEVLIFDEPVASLDPAARRHFLRTILEIVANRDCTVFFSTHITSDLERVADRVALLKGGAIDFCGELDVLKDAVKRLRIRGPVSADQLADLPGVIACERDQQGSLVTVRGFGPQARARIEQLLPGLACEVEDLNLEEIFLELNA